MILPSKKSRIQRQTEESQVPNNKRKYHYYVTRDGRKGVYADYESANDACNRMQNVRKFHTLPAALRFLETGDDTVYYAVRKGFEPGIYLTKEECDEQRTGFSGPETCKFENLDNALAYIDGGEEAKIVEERMFAEEIKTRKFPPPPKPVPKKNEFRNIDPPPSRDEAFRKLIEADMKVERLVRERKRLVSAAVAEARAKITPNVATRTKNEFRLRKQHCFGCTFADHCYGDCLADMDAIELDVQTSALAEEIMDFLDVPRSNSLEHIWLEGDEPDLDVPEDDTRHYDIYTDGSSKGGWYGWAFAVWLDGVLYYIASGNGESPEGRDVCGELAETEAVKHAIAWVVKNHAKDVRILYDYTGLRPPDKENWKSTNQILTDYREFLERVSVLTTIDFERVPGHSGIKGNVIADKVSRRALNRGLHELQKANENRN